MQLTNTFVLVRTRDAGVHMGILAECCGTSVALTDARRLWRWGKANTLNEVSQQGVDMEWTRISEPVPFILLTEAIEVIPCSDRARETLSKSRWGN